MAGHGCFVDVFPIWLKLGRWHSSDNFLWSFTRAKYPGSLDISIFAGFSRLEFFVPTNCLGGEIVGSSWRENWKKTVSTTGSTCFISTKFRENKRIIHDLFEMSWLSRTHWLLRFALWIWNKWCMDYSGASLSVSRQGGAIEEYLTGGHKKPVMTF